MFGFFQVKYLDLILANLGIMLRPLGSPLPVAGMVPRATCASGWSCCAVA